ncbi:MAG: hypothetical protein PWR13_308 [Archaeoglobi archaeon]|nr:hypothetical protein [Archaeoglobi archaeon]MDK2781280.1 hypothetical protein [Archaeoglobi archaeon]
MSLNSKDPTKKSWVMWVMLIIILTVIGVIGWKLISMGYKDQPMFIVQVCSVIVTLLMAFVIWRQTEIMRSQNKILSIDRLPMLIFERENSFQEVETEDESGDNSPNSTENREEAFKVLNVNYAFKIVNVSKYPVRVEYIDFKPLGNHNEDRRSQQILRHIFGVKGIIIPPDQERKIPDKEKLESDIRVPGILKIKASNLYYPDLTLVYEYDLSSGGFEVEGLP